MPKSRSGAPPNRGGNNPCNFFNQKKPGFPRGGKKQNSGNGTRQGSPTMVDMQHQLNIMEEEEEEEQANSNYFRPIDRKTNNH